MWDGTGFHLKFHSPLNWKSLAFIVKVLLWCFKCSYFIVNKCFFDSIGELFDI